MNRNALLSFLSKCDEEQMSCSVCARYDVDEFIDINSVNIADNKLILYPIDERNEIAISFAELKHFLTYVNKNAFDCIILDFEDENSPINISNFTFDDGEFEDVLGCDQHPYFL